MDLNLQLARLLPDNRARRANEIVYEIGKDTLEQTDDKSFWINYPVPIVYKFNSFAYRDFEWNKQADAFVIGDSFSQGIGQPFEETWPYLLEKKLGITIQKICIDGAGNDLLFDLYTAIRQYSNAPIFAMWSFFCRYYCSYQSGTLRMLENGQRELLQIKNSHEAQQVVDLRFHSYWSQINFDNLYYSFVPDWHHKFPMKFFGDVYQHKNFISYSRLDKPLKIKQYMERNDLARDAYHFGPITSEEIAQNFARCL